MPLGARRTLLPQWGLTSSGPTHLQLWPLHVEVGTRAWWPLQRVMQGPVIASGVSAPQCHQRAARGQGLTHLGPVWEWLLLSSTSQALWSITLKTLEPYT